MNDQDSKFFHPLRYPKSRPFSKSLFKKYMTIDVHDPKWLNEQMGDFVQIFNTEIQNYPQPLRRGMIEKHIGNQTDILSQELTLFLEILKFRNRGKNIFYFPSGISSLFKQTDVTEISIGNIKFPYKTFYIAFGPQNEFDIGTIGNEGYFFDGAYIDLLDETTLTIRLTSARKDRDYKIETNWFKYPDSLFWISLKFENTQEKLIQAINRFIEGEKESFENWDEKPRTFEIDGREIETNPLKNSDPQRQKRINRIVNNSEKFKDIAKLIFNAICYLTFEEKEITETYLDNPPITLTDKLEKSKKKRDKQNAEEKLKKGGYSKIKICGQTISSQYLANNIETGKELSTHWRRGHWRNQPFGKNLTELKQTKMIWIRPTLVRKDKGEPQQGHIYTITE